MKNLFIIISIIILFIIILLIVYKHKKYNNNFKNILNDIHSTSSFDEFYIVDEIINTFDFNDIIGKTVETSFYDAFENVMMSTIEEKINNKIKNNGIESIFGNSIIEIESYEKLNSKSKDEITKKLVYDLCHSDHVSNKLKSEFNIVAYKNIEESINIEKEAEKYHATFGKDPIGDPELHPSESKSDANINDEIEEKTISDLYSIGTVEDIDD